jgi:hypothetical protein
MDTSLAAMLREQLGTLEPPLAILPCFTLAHFTLMGGAIRMAPK